MLIPTSYTLAIFLRDQRKRKRLSQANLADLTGLKQTTISACENHPERSKVDTFLRIISALNLDLKLEEKVPFDPMAGDDP